MLSPLLIAMRPILEIIKHSWDIFSFRRRASIHTKIIFIASLRVKHAADTPVAGVTQTGRAARFAAAIDTADIGI